jgi:GMP synthase-like glutamine amidotransferase
MAARDVSGRSTVLYVDTEHESVVNDPELGSLHRAMLDAARGRLATAANATCLVAGYTEVSSTMIDATGAAAVVISGNSTDWARYDFPAMAGLLDAIRAAPVPILGICAGHQLVGFAHGARWGPLGPLAEGEADRDPRFAPGQRKARGFLPVKVDPDCSLFSGLDQLQTFFQSHYWQLEEVPEGFVTRAASASSEIEAIERRDRPVFGVQFHPERYDAVHPAGAIVLRNFFALARA